MAHIFSEEKKSVRYTIRILHQFDLSKHTTWIPAAAIAAAAWSCVKKYYDEDQVTRT